MSTIVTRLGKGSSLSWQEMDDNLTNLNDDKVEVSAITNMLETSDIGVTVQPYDSTILKNADIGVTVQGYDSTTTKNTSTQTLTNKTILAAGGNTVEATSGPSGSPLAGFRNKIINGNFAVNQRNYVSGAAVGANLYGHDRWKMAASADTYTFSTTANKTTITIPAGKVLRQVIEGLNLQTGTYTLSWEGTAQGKIGAGSPSTSDVTGLITGGTDTTIEFGPGTVANVQLEFGSIATPFEHRPIGLELALCRRYYQTIEWIKSSYASAGAQDYYSVVNFAPMRVAPTAVKVGGTFINSTDAGSPAITISSYVAFARSVAAGQVYAGYTVQLLAEL